MEFLDGLIPFADEFAPEKEGDEKNPTRFFWKNTQFSHSDAIACYGILRKLQPRTIVEIGSGHSTLVAIEALARNGAGRIACVEPYPSPWLQRRSDIQLLQQKAQLLKAEWLNDVLKDGDVLFIDSTHTVKTGSDCLHLYLRLLPELRRRIYVHAHDVFLPFGIPKEWLLDQQIFWTEQYLVLALIADNPKARVLYGSAYHKAFSREKLERMMDGKWEQIGGSSFWFEYDGTFPGDRRSGPKPE